MKRQKKKNIVSLMFCLLIIISCNNKSNQINKDFLNGYWLYSRTTVLTKARHIMFFKENEIDYFIEFEGSIPDVRYKLTNADSIVLLHSSGEVYARAKCKYVNENKFLLVDEKGIDTLQRVDEVFAKKMMNEMNKRLERTIEPDPFPPVGTISGE